MLVVAAVIAFGQAELRPGAHDDLELYFSSSPMLSMNRSATRELVLLA